MEPLKQGLELFASGDLEGATRIWIRLRREDPSNKQVAAYLKHVSNVAAGIFARVSAEDEAAAAEQTTESAQAASEARLSAASAAESSLVSATESALAAVDEAAPEGESLRDAAAELPAVWAAESLPDPAAELPAVWAAESLPDPAAELSVVRAAESSSDSTQPGLPPPSREQSATDSTGIAPGDSPTPQPAQSTDYSMVTIASSTAETAADISARGAKALPQPAAALTAEPPIVGEQELVPSTVAIRRAPPPAKTGRRTGPLDRGPIVDGRIADSRTTMGQPVGHDVNQLARSLRQERQPGLSARITGSFSKPDIGFAEEASHVRDRRTTLAERSSAVAGGGASVAPAHSPAAEAPPAARQFANDVTVDLRPRPAPVSFDDLPVETVISGPPAFDRAHRPAASSPLDLVSHAIGRPSAERTPAPVAQSSESSGTVRSTAQVDPGAETSGENVTSGPIVDDVFGGVPSSAPADFDEVTEVGSSPTAPEETAAAELSDAAADVEVQLDVGAGQARHANGPPSSAEGESAPHRHTDFADITLPAPPPPLTPFFEEPTAPGPSGDEIAERAAQRFAELTATGGPPAVVQEEPLVEVVVQQPSAVAANVDDELRAAFGEFGDMIDALQSNPAMLREEVFTDGSGRANPPEDGQPHDGSGESSGRRYSDRPPEATPSIELLETRLRDCVELDDFTSAMEVAQTILTAFPNHEQARVAHRASREKLLHMCMSKVGDPTAVPRLLRSPDELIWLDLDHRAGFVLAQIDGVSCFADIVELTGMGKLESYQILAKLVQDGIVGVSDSAP